MGKSAAFFDIDGTLINGISESILLKELFLKGKISTIAFLKMCFLFFLFVNGFPDATGLRTKAAQVLAGWNVSEFARALDDCFGNKLKCRIFPEAVKTIRRHIRKKDIVVLVSASFSMIAEKYKEYLGVDYVIATSLKVKGGKYTGAISGRACYGSNKVGMVKDFARRHDVDLKKSHGFANHATDADFLGIMGHPVAVNPDKRLLNISKRNGWLIRKFGN